MEINKKAAKDFTLKLENDCNQTAMATLEWFASKPFHEYSCLRTV